MPAKKGSAKRQPAESTLVNDTGVGSSSSLTADRNDAGGVRDSDDGDSDDDEAPEEASNAQIRKDVRRTDNERNLADKRKADARRKIAVARQAQSATRKQKEREREEEQAQAQAPQDAPQHAQRLDPSLFAASFASPSLAPSASAAAQTAKVGKVQALREAAEQRRQNRRKGGIVRGRDGEPMRDLHDGRTIVRVLPASQANINLDSGDDDEEANAHAKEERLDTPFSAFDHSQILPTTKSTRFKERTLGLLANDESRVQEAAKKAAAGEKKKKKRARSDDDPLGLEDPAFMQGGEFVHLGLDSTKKKKQANPFKRTGRAAKGPSTDRRGDAGRRANPPLTRQSFPLQFARSRQA